MLFFAALQQLLDTGAQLQTGELGEWLRKVIVTPTFETLFLVPSTTQCSYSYDRNGTGLWVLADLAGIGFSLLVLVPFVEGILVDLEYLQQLIKEQKEK